MSSVEIVLIVVGIYMAAMLAISAWAKKFVKTADDFLLAGRRLGLILTTATLAATHFGGGFVLGGAGWGARYGLGGLWYGFACGLGLFLLGLTFAKFRVLALYTLPEILEMRYGSYTVRAIAALLSMFALIGITGAQVWAAGAIFASVGLPEIPGAVLATLVFIAYTALSGLWAVAITDFLQIIIGVIGVIVAVILGFASVAGFSSLAEKLQLIPGLPQSPENYFNFMSLGWELFALTLTATVMYTLIGQDFYQRLFAAKDEKTARNSAILSGILLMIVSILPALAGMLALVLSDDPASIIASPRIAIPKLVILLYGPVVGGIFIAAVLAAIMSTADSLLSASTSHIVIDFYRRFKKEVSDKALLRISIIITMIAGFLALIFALTVRGIIELLLYSYDVYTAGVFIPFVLGVLWKRANKYGALAGMISGSAVAVFAAAGVLVFPAWEYTYVSGALISFIVMVIVSLITPKTPIAEEAKKTILSK